MKVIVISALLAVAVADNGPSYQAPASGYKEPAPAYHQPNYDTPPKYNYNYDVHGYGDYAPQFAAQEGRDGYKTQGSYTVALPDGRTQTVTYRVDDAYSGFVADVKYQGEAKYPAYQPQPAYQPAPAYKPAGGKFGGGGGGGKFGGGGGGGKFGGGGGGGKYGGGGGGKY